MRVERRRDSERDIAYMLKALDIVDTAWCAKYEGCCSNKCPLGKLGVFDEPTCHELHKLKTRLELAYKVVETL